MDSLHSSTMMKGEDSYYLEQQSTVERKLRPSPLRGMSGLQLQSSIVEVSSKLKIVWGLAACWFLLILDPLLSERVITDVVIRGVP